MRIEEFKFKLYHKYANRGDVYKHWSSILDAYFQQIYGFTGKLIVYNLKYQDKDGNHKIEFIKDGEEGHVADSNRSLCMISPHKGCLKIEYSTTIENYHKFISKSGETDFEEDEKNEHVAELFSFLIYGQNDCCGALSSSLTKLDYNIQNRKLGTLLQYFKEDLARYQAAALITCTDAYFKGYNSSKNGPVDELKPHLANTMLLLKTGWTVDKLFFNPNSTNVVGVFTKNIKSYQEIEENLEVIMKIKINNNGLVKIDTEKVTIGCDPELFLKSNETGEYVPSFFVMEGDKNNPTPIGKEGHNIQCDNVMVEYGVPPSKNVEEFVKHNLFVQKYIKEEIAEKNNLKMVIFPSARFEEQNLLDERAQRFGCDPDYNAHESGTPNTVGNTKTPWRCSGGHIHVGYENHNYHTNMQIIRAMDLFLSVPLVLMEPENKRKEMYGKAGAFRHQNHGVEYRVTSNYIFSSEELMRWAYNQTIKALEFVNSPKFREFRSWYKVIDTINSKDAKQATELVNEYKELGVCILENSNKLVKS